MNLANLRTELQDVYGNTLSSSNDFYDRIINNAYIKLCSYFEHWWQEKSTLLDVNYAVNTETDCIVNQGTAVATVTAIATTNCAAGSWAHDGNHTYKVTAVATNSITLDMDYISDSSTAASFVLWTDTFDLPTDFDSVIQVTCRGDPNRLPLRPVTMDDIDTFGSNPSDLAAEFADRFAIFMDHDATATSQRYQIRIFPPPDEATAYEVRYRQTPSELSADTDIPMLPTKHHRLLSDMAKLELMKVEGEDVDRIQTYEAEVGKGIRAILNDQVRKGGIQRKFKRRRYGPLARNVQFELTNTAGNEW